MLNPCCCISPRIGAFVFAILDMLVFIPYAWAVVLNFIDQKFHYELLGEVILGVILVFLALLLLLGAMQNSQEKIRLWLMLWIVYLILVLVFQIFNIYQGASQVQARAGSSLGALLIFLYEIWVVYAYLTELRYGPSGLQYCPSQIV